MRPDIVLNQMAASALVRPLRDASEGVIEYGLRLAWKNGLVDARWVVSSESRSIDMRYCPQCLCESQWWRSEWRKLNQVLCLEHHAWLRSRCHACGEPLRLRQTGFLSCACGADHRDAPIRPLSQAMMACLRLERPPSAEVLTWFGAWSLHGPRGKPLKKASVTGAEKRAMLLEVGAEVVMDWPNAWHDSMNRHRGPIDAGKVQRLTRCGVAGPNLVRDRHARCGKPRHLKTNCGPKSLLAATCLDSEGDRSGLGCRRSKAQDNAGPRGFIFGEWPPLGLA